MKKFSISLWAWALNEEDLVESFVQKSIDDLKAVTDDYEIILIDDGSTDRTWEIMQRLAREYTELKIVRHEKNLRPGRCMHSCLKLTTKEIVFWNTVDAFFDSSKLGEWLSELEDCDMIQGIRTDLRANTPYRKLTHLVNYGLIRFLFQINIREFQNVKFCRASFLKQTGLESGSTFTNAECSIKAFWSGKTIKEKSMDFLPRKAGTAKGANPFGILESIRDILKYWFKWVILKQLSHPIQRGKVIKLNSTVWPPQ